jgi:hypothetical protein
MFFVFSPSPNLLLTQHSKKMACRLVRFSFSPREGVCVLQQWLLLVLGGGLGTFFLHVLVISLSLYSLLINTQGRWAWSWLVAILSCIYTPF